MGVINHVGVKCTGRTPVYTQQAEDRDRISPSLEDTLTSDGGRVVMNGKET